MIGMQFSLIGYDYSTLPAERQDYVLERAAQIKALAKRSAAAIIEIGRLLTEVKAALGHGNFGPWLQAEFGWTWQHAVNFMRVYDKFKIILNLDDSALDNFAPTALYRLAEPRTSDKAREAAITLAQSGEYVTASEAENIIEQYQGDRALYSSDSNEWYTPRHIVTKVIKTLGEIDLDPCSNDGDPNVPASNHYTATDDGLNRPWFGRVFMNPPYGREIADWIAKAVNEYQLGYIEQAILLVPSRTDTEWFRTLREYPRCFLWGRIKFVNGDGGASAPAPFPSMAVYLGANVTAFMEAFDDIGDTYTLLQL